MHFFFQDFKFLRNYTKAPTVVLTAKHSTSGGNSAAECNGIVSWIEVILKANNAFYRRSKRKGYQRFYYLIFFFYVFFSFSKFITKFGIRICVKELFVKRFDPLTVSYAVLSGRQSLSSHEEMFINIIVQKASTH